MNAEPCGSFQWIGQPFYSCDRCGWPLWKHSHQNGVGDKAGTEQPLSQETKDRVMQKWLPAMPVDLLVEMREKTEALTKKHVQDEEDLAAEHALNKQRWAIHDMIYETEEHLRGKLYWEDAQHIGDVLWKAGYRKVES